MSNVSAEWPAVPRPNGFNPADSGLRKINPEESMFTTPHRAVRQNGKQSAPAEWQVSASGPLNGQSAHLGAVRPPGVPEGNKGDTLQSLAALRKAPPAQNSAASLVPPVSPLAAAPVVASLSPATPAQPAAGNDGRGGAPRVPAQPAPPRPGAEAGGSGAASTASKRNYPALAAALQTVGYSVAGFLASAVVGLDGTPIAQVSVDETDISPMCTYLSDIIQGAAQVVEPERGDSCDHVIIASGTRYILLRILTRKRDVFQVLITTRETAPVESLVVLTNVESALVAAL
jgi:predicted regulator of Ras-like GTPase activity (Roadblock/LC7/MglB family)